MDGRKQLGSITLSPEIAFVRCHSDTIPKSFRRVLVPARLFDACDLIYSVQFRFRSRNEWGRIDSGDSKENVE